MKKIVLSLCDHSSNMVRPWAEAGFECYCIDLKHPRGTTTEGNIHKVGDDVLWFANYEVSDLKPCIVFAFPPCTHLAVSGARWFQAKGMDALIGALQVVNACRKICEHSGAPYMIENPISTLATYWRKPDHIFDPCEYGGYEGGAGDTYTKKTCLWTGGGFRMPAKKPVLALEGSRMHLMPPGENRAELRSLTPEGFARAVFEANREVCG